MKLITRDLFFCFTLLLADCSLETTEIERVSNSSKSIDAVVVLQETGATVATPIAIYLRPVIAKSDSHPIFRADHVSGLKVTWTGDFKLIIHAEEARVLLIKDRLDVDIAGKNKQPINIALDARYLL
ncbi:MAG: hypothetical protein ACRYGK_03040 [Janthinobacterium lividum]